MDTKELLGIEYRPRITDRSIASALEISGGIGLEGARGCGKTMSGAHHARSAILLDNPDSQILMSIDPSAALSGNSPRLIDEWQLYPDVWNLTRRAIDHAGLPGQFILTGSSVPSDDITRHTGAARFLRIPMHTLTWAEKQREYSPAVSFESLSEGVKPATNPDVQPLSEAIELLLRSGFPAHNNATPDQSLRLLRGYINEVSRTDVSRLAEIRHEPMVIEQLMSAIARNSAEETSITTLRKDLLSIAPDLSLATVARYMELLERLFIVEKQTAWTPRLQSRARLRTSPKYHLVDPALAAAALNADETLLMREPTLLGSLFESAVVHDLTVMTEALGGTVYHFRDSNGYEMDAVCVLPGGRWAGIEVKLGGRLIVPGAERLAQVAAVIAQPPVFLAVITATGPTLTFPSGVHTFPIARLGM